MTRDERRTRRRHGGSCLRAAAASRSPTFVLAAQPGAVLKPLLRTVWDPLPSQVSWDSHRGAGGQGLSRWQRQVQGPGGGAGGGVSTAHSSWHHRFLRGSLLSLSLKCGFSSETTKLLSAGLKLPCLLTSFTFSCENRTRRKALHPGDPPARVASSIFSRVNSVLWKLEITHFLVTNFTACILHLLGLTWGVFNQH